MSFTGAFGHGFFGDGFGTAHLGEFPVCQMRARPLVLEGERDFVGWDCAFADNHPGVGAAAEVDDGGGGRAGSWAAVYDERDFVAELLQDGLRVGAFCGTAEVGGGGRDREAELRDNRATDGGFGDSERYVAGVGGNAEGELAAGFDDDGEWAGPEAFGEFVEGDVDAAGEFVGLRDVGDEKREGLVAGAGFELVDAVDGAEVYGVDGQSVKGVGGQGGYVAGVEAVDDAVDERGFGLIGIDAEDFGVHRVGRGPQTASSLIARWVVWGA